MKLSLPIKLGVFVVLVFSVVIAVCLLWTPLKIRYYTAKLESNNPNTRVKGVDALLHKGTWGRKLLVEYCICSEKEIEFLTKHWLKPNDTIAGDEYNNYPLHLAAMKGYCIAIKLFAEKKADVNAKNRIHWTPLFFSVKYKKIAATKALIFAGAKMNYRNREGWTALHIAAIFDSREVGILLINKGMNVNEKDEYGCTPLHHTVLYGNLEFAEYLVEHGADLSLLNYHNQTPIDVASSEEQSTRNPVKRERIIKVKDYLISAGAKTSEELKKEQEKK